MGFVYKSLGRAHDFWRGITIEPVRRFEDLGPDDGLPYCYSQGDLAFEFDAVTYSDWRLFTSLVSTELRLMSTASYIIEDSIKSGLQRAGCRSVLVPKYQDLKGAIAEGMLALSTRGGYHFRFIPDFQVKFVDTWTDVPRRPPRPLDPNTVTAASLSEKLLSLGDKKNIAFVYEQYEAHDAERNITITRLNRFEDSRIDDPGPYRYSDRDLVFEFRASIYREWRTQLNENAAKMLRPHTATYVIEDSIKEAVTKEKRRSLAAEGYLALRQNIKDGMWVAETTGGRSLRDIPDFRLEFVDTAMDVPRWPPRPPD
jgi:hypothetical protein